MHQVIGLCGLFLGFLVYLAYFQGVGSRPTNYPPGPPTLPLIGNLHQMPGRPEQNGPQFEKWAREYGPIYSLILGTQVWIILSKDQVIKDLLDKRGAIYSSRPDAYLVATIFSGGMRAFLIKGGNDLKRNRKLGRLYLSESKSRQYIPYQDLENKRMLVDFLHEPSQYINHLRRFTSSLTTQIVFGFRVVTMDEALPQKLFKIFDLFSEMSFTVTAALLDAYPILRAFPHWIMPLKRQAAQLHDTELALFRELYFAVKQKVSKRAAPPCFAKDLSQVQEEEGIDDDLAAYTAGSLLQGGLGSTSETMTGFLKAMVLFPGVAKQAQAELDCVCGSRMPELDDWTELPYVRCCIREALRWFPVSPMGIPHELIRDDEYMGYTLPEHSVVICNVRAIHTDEERYPNPREFDPTRWTNHTQSSAESAANGDVKQRDHFVFGAGRRVCQGTYIAERSLFLGISRLLWAFNIRRPVDPKTGVDVPMSGMDDLQGGMFVMPRTFPVSITVRDETKRSQIMEAWERSRTKNLDENFQWKPTVTC